LQAQIVQSRFQIFVAFSGECLFSCVFHKLKYFSKLSCVSKSNDSFLRLKHSSVPDVRTFGRRIHTRNAECFDWRIGALFLETRPFLEKYFNLWKYKKINIHHLMLHIHSFIHFIQFHQSITRCKRPDGYRVSHNTLYLTLIHKFNM
jgi:hypothetical protein